MSDRLLPLLRLLGGLAPDATETRALRAFSTSRGPRSAAPPPGATHEFTLTGGRAPLRVWEWGGGDARAGTVLLVHGWNGHAGQLAAFVPALLARGFHVVAFDQPAHGRSGGTEANVVDFRDALLAVARRLAPVHAVVAHSLGATATVLAMADGLTIRRAVLLAPPADLAPFVRGFGRALRLPEARIVGMIARAQAMLGVTSVADPSLASRLSSSPGSPPSARVLVVHDPDDPEVPFAHGQALARSLPSARLHPMPGFGHGRLLTETPVVDLVSAFVEGRERPPARPGMLEAARDRQA